MLDFADFDRRFELKINEASEDLIAKKEQGKCSCPQCFLRLNETGRN